MISKVDYFSYTFYINPDEITEIENHLLMPMLKKHKPDYVSLPEEPTRAPARRGFAFGVSIGKHTYIWLSSAGLILVEHTGQGCELLAANGTLNEVIASYADRATRIDIASDILTETMPTDFHAQSVPTARISASGHQSSESGQTVYIGSKKSDRTCKVYRYFEPHPRAAFLRVEYTYRRQQAKIVARMLASGTTADAISVSSGKRYGWQHACYKPLKSTDQEIKAWRPERRQGKTVVWLYSQCVPAIKRLVDEGVLDLEEFIDKCRS